MTKAERLRAWRAANPEKVREQRRRAYEKMKLKPGFIEENRARVSKWQKENAEYVNARHRGDIEPREPESRLKPEPATPEEREAIEAAEVAADRARTRRCVRRRSGVREEDLTGEKRSGRCANERCDYDGPLHFDHHRASGHFRGWLCPTCNRGLGSFHESVPKLLGIIAYVEKFLTDHPECAMLKDKG